jgi:hypothetical protein
MLWFVATFQRACRTNRSGVLAENDDLLSFLASVNPLEIYP